MCELEILVRIPNSFLFWDSGVFTCIFASELRNEGKTPLM